MRRLNNYRYRGRHVAICKSCETDQVVREGLSYSPSQMAKLTERGMPVNSMNTQQVFVDGEENPTFFVPAERERYVDVCDLWEHHMILRDKARSASKSRKQKL